MAKGEIIRAATFNNIAAQLRNARNKYYGGYGVADDIGAGTPLTAGKVNELLNQCTAVSAKSPRVYSFGNVSPGSIIQETIFANALSNITNVATCYSNCHSNCYSNCYNNCNHHGGGRCPD